MRLYEERTRQVTERIYVERRCELCGRAETFLHHSPESWAEDVWQVSDVRVSYTEGVNYPDCKQWVELSIDICPQCFMEKLIPWVKEQGGEVNRKEFAD